MRCTGAKDLKVKEKKYSSDTVPYPMAPRSGKFWEEEQESPQSPCLLETVFLDVFSGTLARPPCSPLKIGTE